MKEVIMKNAKYNWDDESYDHFSFCILRDLSSLSISGPHQIPQTLKGLVFLYLTKDKVVGTCISKK